MHVQVSEWVPHVHSQALTELAALSPKRARKIKREGKSSKNANSIHHRRHSITVSPSHDTLASKYCHQILTTTHTIAIHKWGGSGSNASLRANKYLWLAILWSPIICPSVTQLYTSRQDNWNNARLLSIYTTATTREVNSSLRRLMPKVVNRH